MSYVRVITISQDPCVGEGDWDQVLRPKNGSLLFKSEAISTCAPIRALDSYPMHRESIISDLSIIAVLHDPNSWISRGQIRTRLFPYS